MTSFYQLGKRLLRGLGSLDSLDQHRGDLEQIAADAVIGDLEDGSGVVLVDGNDALGILHTSLVLDSAGDTRSPRLFLTTSASSQRPLMLCLFWRFLGPSWHFPS